MPKRLSQEEFIERATEVHNGKYDYSKVSYVNSTTDICIICPIHGEFWQRPTEHLRGKGCIKCGQALCGEKQKQKAKEKIAHLLRLPNEQPGKTDYLTGSKTTADIYLYITLTWAKKFEIDLSDYKNLDTFVKRIEEDKGLTAVIEQQGLEKIKTLEIWYY